MTKLQLKQGFVRRLERGRPHDLLLLLLFIEF